MYISTGRLKEKQTKEIMIFTPELHLTSLPLVWCHYVAYCVTSIRWRLCGLYSIQWNWIKLNRALTSYWSSVKRMLAWAECLDCQAKSPLFELHETSHYVQPGKIPTVMAIILTLPIANQNDKLTIPHMVWQGASHELLNSGI